MTNGEFSARYRNRGATDIPLPDGASIVILEPLPDHLYDRAEVGRMFYVAAVGGQRDGERFQLFEDEIEVAGHGDTE